MSPDKGEHEDQANQYHATLGRPRVPSPPQRKLGPYALFPTIARRSGSGGAAEVKTDPRF